MGATAIDATKTALLDAAEVLMAEHGIDGAELGEIQQLAGQRNKSAIAYHFGDRDGLLRAVGARRRQAVNQHRNQILDRLEHDHQLTLPTLVDATVRPLATGLDTPQLRAYLIVLAEATSRLGSTGILAPDRSEADSVRRVSNHLIAILPGTRARGRRLVGRAMLITPHLVADLAREINRGAITLAQGRRQISEVVTFLTHSLTDSSRG